MKISSKAKKSVAVGAMLLAGAGTAAAVSGSASAASDAVTNTATTAGDAAAEAADPTKSMRSDEELLTGSTAEKVTAAAMAKYPDATIQRVETDSDGVYEAHMVTADGQQVIVQVGEDFTVTGTQTGGPGGGRGGPGDHRDDHGAAGGPSGAPTQSGSATQGGIAIG